MCFANGRCLLCIAFLVLFAALLILAVVHRVRAKKKVLALTPGERVRLLWICLSAGGRYFYLKAGCLAA